VVNDKKGSVMLLVIVVIAAVTVIASLILSISMSQFRIRKSNSELRRAFYLSEDGLNRTYSKIYELMCAAIEESMRMSDEYLADSPENIEMAEAIYKNSYKRYMLDNISGCTSRQNPYTEITNRENLAFMSGKLTIRVKSTYISESGTKKYTSADIVVCIPSYTESGYEYSDDVSRQIYYAKFEL